MGEIAFVIASDGIKLAAHVSGNGPPLYVLHGGPMNDHRTFGDYLDPIAEYRTLHLLDQRGCGDWMMRPWKPTRSRTSRRISKTREQG